MLKLLAFVLQLYMCHMTLYSPVLRRASWTGRTRAEHTQNPAYCLPLFHDTGLFVVGESQDSLRGWLLCLDGLPDISFSFLLFGAQIERKLAGYADSDVECI